MRPFLALLLVSLGLFANPPTGADNSALAIQTVGPDDLLSIAVADSPELTRNFRVFADGTLVLPLIKQKLRVAGMNTSEIEQAISDALVREQILVSPVVSVSVAEYRSLPVSVLGAVRSPTTFQAAGEVRLLDALTRAGGLAADAGPEILVSSPSNGDSPAMVQRIPVKELIDEANPVLNVRIRGGEEIRVPSAGRVYLLGNVKRPGAFTVQDNGDLTILKVIAESEGLLPFASKQAYIYRRLGTATARTEIPIPIRLIMDRKAPDMPLQANDIVYIPDDKHKRLTANVIERAAGFGMATASGLLIFH